MAETRNLPPVGDYSLFAAWRHDAFGGSGTVFCRSEEYPVVMDIHYPGRQFAGADSDGTVPSDPYYALEWPTDLPKDAALDALVGVGRSQPDSAYHWASVDDAPVLNKGRGFPWPRALSSKELELPHTTTSAEDLSQALEDRFIEALVISPALVLMWKEESLVNERADDTFTLISGNNDPITEPPLKDIVERTISAKHAGTLAVVLETLGAVFEQYEDWRAA